MYNLRYHVASLVSVFLALAIGLVLGGLVVNKSTVGSDSSIVKGLQKEFASLRTDNQTLTTRLENEDSYATAATKKLVAGSLAGKTVIVLGLNDDAEETAHDALVQSGAKVVLVTVNTDKLGLDKMGSKSTVYINSLVAASGQSDVNTALSAELVREWSQDATAMKAKDALKLTKMLIKKGVLDTTEPAAFSSVGGVVDVAAKSEDAATLSLAIAQATAAGAKIPTVCAAPTKDGAMFATKAWKKKIAATDMLGTPIGTYTLTAVLNGAEPALYGSLDAAKALYPKMK